MKLQVVVASFILGFFIGFILGAKSCSTHTVSYRTDTLTITKPPQYIEGKTKFVTKLLNSRASVETVFVPIEKAKTDSSICMDCLFKSDTIRMSDSAKIVSGFRPRDLAHTIWYQPPPEKIIRIFQTESPPKENWGIGFGVGFGLMQVDDRIVARPNVSVTVYRKILGF